MKLDEKVNIFQLELGDQWYLLKGTYEIALINKIYRAQFHIYL